MKEKKVRLDPPPLANCNRRIESLHKSPTLGQFKKVHGFLFSGFSQGMTKLESSLGFFTMLLGKLKNIFIVPFMLFVFFFFEKCEIF